MEALSTNMEESTGKRTEKDESTRSTDAFTLESIDFVNVPSALRERLYFFDAGGVYARGIFLGIPCRGDADYEILEGGRKLRIKPRRRLRDVDFKCAGVAVLRAGTLTLHFLNLVGATIQGE